MFIGQNTLNTVFLNMRETAPTSKSGMERTTSLFRFLAFNMLSHEERKDILDLSPENSDTRNRLIQKYDDLAKVGNDSEVSNLGVVIISKRFGSARVGNDFLTSQLKQGSERRQREGVEYPKRPAPILQIACGDNYWSVKNHRDWKENIKKFIEGRSSSPFTCLSIFCLKNIDLGQNTNRAQTKIIAEALNKLFPQDVALYLASEIEIENSSEGQLSIDFQKERPSLDHLKISDVSDAEDNVSHDRAADSLECQELFDLVSNFKNRAQIGRLYVEQALVKRIASCLLSKRFLIATGLAGSGKTKLVQAFARWLTPSHFAGDVFSPGSEIQSANVTYYVKRADNLSVEFWNASNERDAVKVTLPREMITEWAAYIERNSIPQSTPAREIREAVKATSKYSDQLHSFETHLKAAAFALVNSQLSNVSGSCYAIVPVGADWTGNENILGYPDGLEPSHYVARPALDLIVHAKDHKEVPHFLILDEMNLSHVERYFADILSTIESDEELELYPGDMKKPDNWRKTSAGRQIPPKLKQLPENLFIIGTVNVDETTYQFSPKVLDRANVIEFRMDDRELEGFLVNPAKPDLAKFDGTGAVFGEAFVKAATNPVSVPSEVRAAYDAEMLLLFKTLQTHGAEFGYRTAYDTARFIHFYKLLGNHSSGDTNWFSGAFDCVIFQKLLPKLHGSRAKLGPVLKKLWFLCVSNMAVRGDDALKAAEESKAEPNKGALAGAYYPMSAEKILRMWRLLNENGFTSFAEA